MKSVRYSINWFPLGNSHIKRMGLLIVPLSGLKKRQVLVALRVFSLKRS